MYDRPFQKENIQCLLFFGKLTASLNNVGGRGLLQVSWSHHLRNSHATSGLY